MPTEITDIVVNAICVAGGLIVGYALTSRNKKKKEETKQNEERKETETNNQ